MSKEELLKYLIAEIDLIMHDKDYRFENDNGTWYSRESCRDLTNEEVLEELRTELRQFADLEAKLAELREQIDIRDEENGKIFMQSVNAMRKNVELKQQLAEKDKELKQLKLDLGMFKSVNEFINKYGIEKAREVLLQIEKTKNQDKISFAIEELEKVLVLIHNAVNIDSPEYDLVGLYDAVSKQIKQLKEGWKQY